MFWRVSAFAQPSAIETILNRPDCKLEDILAEDQLIQEIKGQNTWTMDYLAKPETVQGLVRHLVVPPTPDTEQGPAQRLSQVACEVLCCEVDAILTALLQSEAALELLFSLLQQTPPLECTTAGYFARVVGMLLFRRTDEVMAFLKERWHLLTRLVVHLETTSICEILVRLTGAEEHTGMYLPPSKVKWLLETSLMADLLAVLGPDQGGNAARHASEVLVSVCRSTLSPLQAALGEPPFLSTLLSRAFDVGSTSSVQALDVCIALLDPRGGEPPSPIVSTGSVFASSSPPAQTARAPGDVFRRSGSMCLASLQSRAVSELVPYADRLGEMLLDSCAPAMRQTSHGVLKPPLGTARLKAAEMVAALACVGVPAAEAALAAGGLLQRCMELFAQYPFNNLLHHQVTLMLVGVLDRAAPSLVQHLFREARLLTWLIQLPGDVEPQQREFDSPSLLSSRRPLRAGYLGHVTYIANKIVEVTPRLTSFIDELETDDNWHDYCDGPLKDRNSLENTDNWECGRPQVPQPAADQGAEGSLMDLEPPAGISGLELPGDTESAIDDLMDGWTNEPTSAHREYIEQDDEDSSPGHSQMHLPKLQSRHDALDLSDSGDDSPPWIYQSADAQRQSPDRAGGGGVLVDSTERDLGPGAVGDDAVVIGMSNYNNPPTLPPVEPAVVPQLEHQTPQGLDATKAPCAAVPQLLPKASVRAGSDRQSILHVLSPSSPNGSLLEAPEVDNSSSSSSSAAGRARSSVASTAAWLRMAGSRVTSATKERTSSRGLESLSMSGSLSATNRIPPRSAFASWRPAWQAVEEAATAAAASAAADFVARSSSTAPPRPSVTPADPTSDSQMDPGMTDGSGAPPDASTVAAQAKSFGANRVRSGMLPANLISGTMPDRSGSLPTKSTHEVDTAWDTSADVSQDVLLKSSSEDDQSSTSNDTSDKLSIRESSSWVLTDRKSPPSDGCPRFDFSGIKAAMQVDTVADIDSKD